MVKVLFPVVSFDYGGVITVNRQYSRILKKIGYQTILMGFEGSIPLKELSNDFSQVITLKTERSRNIIAKVIAVLKYRSELKKIISSSKKNELIFHISINEPFLIIMSIISAWKYKKISAVYGFYFLEKISQGARWYQIVLNWFLQYVQLIMATKITVLTQYSVKMIRNHFPLVDGAKMVMIPATLPRLPTISKSSLTHKPLSIFNYGRAEERKNIVSLLHAIAIINKLKIRAELIIAGTVKYYKYTNILDTYEQLNLFNSVNFLHSVNKKQVDYLFDQADVFVMPSKDLETFGITMLTSLSKGIPVIGTPIGSIYDVLSLVDDRLLCEDVTPNAIYKKILWYFNLTQSERKKLSIKSRLVVKKYYLDKHYIKTILNLYE